MNSTVKKIIYIGSAVIGLVGVLLAIFAMFVSVDGTQNVWDVNKDWPNVRNLMIETYKVARVNASTKDFALINSTIGMASYGSLVAIIVSVIGLGAAGFGIFMIFTGKETKLWMDITIGITTLIGFSLAIAGLITAFNATSEEWMFNAMKKIAEKLMGNSLINSKI